MKRETKIGSWVLLALVFIALALPAWGDRSIIAPTTPSKPVTSVTASYPLKSSGGTTPNISLEKVGKVAIVAQSGGDYTSPVMAMNEVATWCGTPSASNPCLVKIMPGVYDLAGGSLSMMAYVDIEGSGENSTVITSAYTYNRDSGPGVVNGADNAELRLLTIVDKTPYPYRPLVIANDGQSPKITHVTASVGDYAVSKGLQPNIPISSSCGVYNKNSSPTMTNVMVKATGRYGNYGIYNENASPTMSNVMVIAEGGDACWGIYNDGSSLTMNNVIVKASGGSPTALYSSSTSAVTIFADRSTFEASGGPHPTSVSNGSNVTLRIGASKLIGEVGNDGTLTCAASYNGDYIALGTNCQPSP